MRRDLRRIVWLVLINSVGQATTGLALFCVGISIPEIAVFLKEYTSVAVALISAMIIILILSAATLFPIARRVHAGRMRITDLLLLHIFVFSLFVVFFMVLPASEAIRQTNERLEWLSSVTYDPRIFSYASFLFLGVFLGSFTAGLAAAFPTGSAPFFALLGASVFSSYVLYALAMLRFAPTADPMSWVLFLIGSIVVASISYLAGRVFVKSCRAEPSGVGSHDPT